MKSIAENYNINKKLPQPKFDYALKIGEVSEKNGTLGEVRTHDPRIRNPMLYPTELRGHLFKNG
jgi:hypothetical protein